jgi:CubicO group peptidase (beta-lactamase class C family)
MTKHTLISVVIVYIFAVQGESQAQSLYFPPPTGTWETISPESLGWCTDSINSLMNFLDSNHTKAFMVLKDGRIVLEQYFGTFTADSLWYWASAGKTLTAFLIGIACRDGLIFLDDSVSLYLGSGWTSCPPDKEKLIKIWNLLTMTSGLDDWVPNSECTTPDCLLYKTDAGTRWAYHTGAYTMLDGVIEAATGKTVNVYSNEKVRSRINMGGIWFPVGYNNVYFSNARGMARFGLLLLNRGIWENDTLLADTSYFNSMINTSQNMNLSYGYLTWLNGKDSYMIPVLQTVFPGSWAPDAPAEMFAAIGKDGQFINIIPEQRLIMVRMGDPPDTSYDVPMQFNNDIWIKLNHVIIPAMVGEKNAAPFRLALEQNYPNPFNPNTTIEFRLERRTDVTLKIFDVLGRYVETLINTTMQAGTHYAVWNAENLSSGIYFYSLQAGGKTEVKKLILLR